MQYFPPTLLPPRPQASSLVITILVNNFYDKEKIEKALAWEER